MSESAPEHASPLVDLTGIKLDRIAHLCARAAGNLVPDDLEDRPVLRRALRRVQEEAERTGETFVGHSNLII